MLLECFSNLILANAPGVDPLYLKLLLYVFDLVHDVEAIHGLW